MLELWRLLRVLCLCGLGVQRPLEWGSGTAAPDKAPGLEPEQEQMGCLVGRPDLQGCVSAGDGHWS